MLQALAILLLLQLAGEFIGQFLDLPVPGPVIGMALFFAAMQMSSRLAERVRDTANTVLSHLSLLFVPAGVGVMLHVQRIADEWLAITLALTLGTVITLVVTALSIRFCLWLAGPRGGDR
jgi:holin-like protein